MSIRASPCRAGQEEDIAEAAEREAEGARAAGLDAWQQAAAGAAAKDRAEPAMGELGGS